MVNSNILNELYAMERIYSEKWPTTAFLYHPLPSSILLPESASCLAVKTYLAMCNLPYEIIYRNNVEFMSGHGRLTKVPLLRVGNDVISEFEPIVAYIKRKDLAIGDWMSDEDFIDMRTYVTLVENTCTMAELSVSYKDATVFKNVTAPRYGSVYPWPLNYWQVYRKRQEVLRQLRVYEWHKMTMDQVLLNFEKCCKALDLKLCKSPYKFFYSDEPCDLDAVVFGHLFTIITTKLSNSMLEICVKKFSRLLDFCLGIDHAYFKT